jgi:hypothetical protein
MYTWIGIAFILLIVVIWNNFRVNKARRKRNQQSFRKRFRERKKEKH